LTPDNILLNANLTPCISGFWLSALVDHANALKLERCLGTPEYMAPRCLMRRRTRVKTFSAPWTFLRSG
jgi:serine/threonine protein kinase